MLELTQTMREGVCEHPETERLVLELAMQLETVKGKKSYGYLLKRLKTLVDKIVDEMERLPAVSKRYDQWLLLQGKVDTYYRDKPRERIPLSRQKEFRQIRNAVIQEAERLRVGEVSFEEMREHCPPSVALAVTQLLYHISRIFQENSAPKLNHGSPRIDRKRWKKLKEKRIAMGHKPDDHEWYGMTM